MRYEPHPEVLRWLRELGGRPSRHQVERCSILLRMPRTGSAAPKTEAWFRRLDSERIEIFLKFEPPQGQHYKLRCSGPEEEMYELVSWFEERTGTTVSGDWRRVRTGRRLGPEHMTLDIEEAGGNNGSDVP